MGEQRPDGACVLVGECDGRHVLVAPCQQPREPGVGLRLSLGNPHYGPRPVDQECSKVDIPAFADAEQVLFAATGVLPRHETEEGGQLPTVAEGLRIPDRGDNFLESRRGGHIDGFRPTLLSVSRIPELVGALENETNAQGKWKDNKNMLFQWVGAP